jgi:hypothetical protein
LKIYIASSWKNERAVGLLALTLRHAGHKVDCFTDTSTGRYVFHFSEIGPREELDAISFLDDPRSIRAFAEDRRWLDWCEAVVMLLPCGKSSHLEAGYAVGKGKKLFIIGDFPKGEFDVTYGFATALVRLPDELIYAIELSSRKEWRA